MMHVKSVLCITESVCDTSGESAAKLTVPFWNMLSRRWALLVFLDESFYVIEELLL